MAVSTATLIFGTLAPVGLTYAGQILVGGLVFGGVSMIVGKALGLGGAPDFDMSGVGGNIGTTIDPLAASQLVYGTIRKGGVKTFHETTGSNKFYHYFLTLAHHEINSIPTIYINDEVATLDASGYVTSQSWNSKILIRKYLGTDNQNIHADLTGIANTPTQIGNTFKGQGVACLYVRLEYDADVFQNGMPDISAVVQGKKIYDPRKDSTNSSYDASLGVSSHRLNTATTWQYSSNPALALADYLLDTKGVNVFPSEIDYDMVATAADDCGQIGAAGVTSNSFEVDGIVNCGTTKQDNINAILSAFNATLFFGQGKFRLVAGAYHAPASGTLFTLDDVRSAISIQTRHSRRDLINTVKGTFNNRDNRWIADEFPKIQLSDMSEDNNIESVADISMPLVTKPAAAQRLAKQILFTSREQINLTAVFSSKAYKLQVGDVITLTLPRYGFTAKEFLVNGWKAVGGDGSPIEVELKLQEISSIAYQWSVSSEEYQAMLTNNTSLDRSDIGLAISTITVTAPTPKLGVDRTYIGYLALSWTAPNNSQVTGYDVEYKRDTESVYTATTSTTNSAILEPLNVGFTYDIRIRSINNRGNKGAYKTASGTVSADTTAPAVPQWKSGSVNSEVVGGFKQVTLEWDRPTATDFAHVEVYFLTGGNYVKLTNAFDETYNHVGLSDATSFSYKLKSVDLAGNVSAFSASKTATTQAALVDGTKGQKGQDAVDGTKGQKGQDAVDGAKGQKGQDAVDGAKGQKGDDAVDGTKGQKGSGGTGGPKVATKRAYIKYTPTNATGTDVPAAPQINYNWGTGGASFTPSSVSGYSWSLTAPTKNVNSALNVYFSDFILNGSAAAANTIVTGSTPKQGTNFEGIVSFTSGNFKLDGGAITTIDGGNIVTNSVRTEQIEIDNNLSLIGTTSGIIGGRDGQSNYSQAGFFFGREGRPTVGGSGVIKGRQYEIVSNGTSNFISSGAPTNDAGTVFTMTTANYFGTGVLRPIGYEVSHSSVNSSDELEGIIHNEIAGLKIYNADLISGGDVVAGVNFKTTTGFTNLGSGASLGTVTIRAIGGGGGGGFGRDNGTATSQAASGGTTQVRLRSGSQSGTILATVASAEFGAGGAVIIAAGGGSGGLDAPNINQQGGLAGFPSSYGAGGASVGQGVVGNDAPSTHYGAGGGGAGGDSQGWFGTDGAGGNGGSDGNSSGGVYDVSGISGNIFLDVTSIGSGGAGGNNATQGMAGFAGGDGAGGFVEHSSIIGSTVTKQIKDLATTGLGAVGSYAYLLNTVNQNVSPNSTRAASTLRYSGTSTNSLTNSSGFTVVNNHGTQPSDPFGGAGGTWRAMGGKNSTNYAYLATLWVRIV